MQRTSAGRSLNLELLAAVARLGFRRQFAYPQAALWGLLTNLFFGVLRVAVLVALFGTQTQVAGYTLAGAVTYVALGQALIAATSLFGWYDWMRAIHRGEVTGDLLRPHSPLVFWAAQDLGRAAGQLVLRGVPLLAVFAALYGLLWPAGPEGWALTLLSAALMWTLGFLFRFLVNCAAFWSPDAVGIGRFAWALLGLGSGFLMPLAFFPDRLRWALSYTPFPGMMNTTVEIWLGVQTGAAAWQAVGVQAAWTAALGLLTVWVLRRGLRRLELAGG